MIITEWMKCPFDTGTKEIWMKNTPTNRGPMTVLPSSASLGGNQSYSLKATPTEISDRRFSVIERESGINTAIIGAISYESGYDTLNEPTELFEQYLSGNFNVLLSMVGLTVEWDGSSQELLEIF